MKAKFASTLVVALVVVVAVRADLASDKAECMNPLMAMATCLPFATGSSPLPTKDCCTGLHQVIDKSPKCLCLLIKDHNDPSLGLHVDATRALMLPSHCGVPISEINRCPKLLNLAPNSPDARMFTDFAKRAQINSTSDATNANGNPTRSSATTATASNTSRAGVSSYYRSRVEGGRKLWLVLEIFGGIWVYHSIVSLLFIM